MRTALGDALAAHARRARSPLLLSLLCPLLSKPAQLLVERPGPRIDCLHTGLRQQWSGLFV